VEDGIKSGAKLIGKLPEKDQKGYFIRPLTFINCHQDMKIVKEEIFGPVAVILKFKTV
jgi:aldehyde dehydrogenase (NAD+)